MNELNSGLDLRIHLPGREPHALRDYLPDAFGPKDLDIKTLLMDEQDHGFALQGDALTQAAIAAANAAICRTATPQAVWHWNAKTVKSSAVATLKTPLLTPRCLRCRVH